MLSLNDDTIRAVSTFVGACGAATSLAPSSTALYGSICKRANWRKLFPGWSSPASACGADAWLGSAPVPVPSTAVRDIVSRFRARGDALAAVATEARGVKVTVTPDAFLFVRGTGGIVGSLRDGPPLRVLRPSAFAADGDRVVAFARQAPSRALEVRWLPTGSSRGSEAWRSCFVSLAHQPRGLAVRALGSDRARAALAVYHEQADVSTLFVCDVDLASRLGATTTVPAAIPKTKGLAGQVVLLGGRGAAAAVSFCRPLRCDVFCLSTQRLLARVPSARGLVSRDAFDVLVAWGHTSKAFVRFWHVDAPRDRASPPSQGTDVAGVDPVGMIQACVARRDCVFVLKLDGDLSVHRLLGSRAHVPRFLLNVAAVTRDLRLDKNSTLCACSRRPGLFLKCGTRDSGDALYEIRLPT